MPVRGEGLRYVLSALIIWYTPTLLGQIIMIAVLLLWYIRYHHHSTIWYVLFLIFACWWIQEDIVVNPTSQIIQVKEIASNYVIGSDHTQRYILYGLEEVGIDDVVLSLIHIFA